MSFRRSLRSRYPTFKWIFDFVRKNAQIYLVVVLFIAGLLATYRNISTLAGALFGAGAAMLGAWITDWNRRQADAEGKLQRQREARQYLAPELNRTIGRILYIHGRAIPNFVSASAGHEIKPNDLKQDFIPYWPVLFPTAPQVRDLSGDEAVALIAFYDSLHSLAASVNDWWEREGQLPVNLFLSFLHQADESLKLALVCIERFELERLYPPPYESWGTISSRIERSLLAAEDARKHHIARFEAKAGNKTPPPSRNPKRA